MKLTLLDHTMYDYIQKYLSFGQRYKIIFLVSLFVVFPFIRMFSNYFYAFDLPFSIPLFSILNYSAIIGCGLAFLLHRKEYSLGSLLTVVTVILLLMANFFLAEMAQINWAINWLGFMFMFLIISQLLKNLTDAEIYVLQIKLIKVFSVIIFLFTIMTLYALIMEPWYLDPRYFNYYVFEDRNQIHRLYRDYIGTHKQHFGIFSLIIFSFLFTHWKIMANKARLIFIAFVTINIVAIFGVRTLILASTVGMLAFYFLKNSTRKTFAFLIFLFFSLTLYMYRVELYDTVVILYDRLPSLQFAFDAATQNLFGLGNGGYAIFVEENNERLLAQFGSDLMERHGVFWKAPESDLVYFIASWGILSIIFFSFLGFLIFRAVTLFHHNKSLYPIERLILLCTVLLILTGFSNDNAGKLTWWIYVSSLFGVILRSKMNVNIDQSLEPDNPS